MDDLVTWLRAQLDDDERVARQLVTSPGGVYLEAETEDTNLMAVGAHLLRWSPARVRAEVDAKRRVLDQHDAMQAAVEASEGTILAGAARVRLGAYAFVVKCLALPYAARPGYRDEWRPE